MSKVWSRANNLVVNGDLTPEKGIEVVRWAVKKEAELKAKTDPKKWEEIVRDNLDGRTLADGILLLLMNKPKKESSSFLPKIN